LGTSRDVTHRAAEEPFFTLLGIARAFSVGVLAVEIIPSLASPAASINLVSNQSLKPEQPFSHSLYQLTTACSEKGSILTYFSDLLSSEGYDGFSVETCSRMTNPPHALYRLLAK